MNEPAILLLILLVLGVPIAFVIWVIIKLNRHTRDLEHASLRVELVERELRQLRGQVAAKPAAHFEPVSLPVSPPVLQPVSEPLPQPVTPPVTPTAAELATTVASPHASSVPTPPPLLPVTPKPTAALAPEPARPELPAFDWEQFMGVKLFAWIGGFVLFLALIFFLKYAFENHLISPQLQVALEYVFAIGLLGVGVWLTSKSVPVVAQTLCATSVVALYAVTFAMRVYYHLAPMPVAFGLMGLVTVTAFVLAGRLDAQVVAVLGLLGGFMTPVMLSTGQDNPLGLFGYLGLLNAGILAVVRNKRTGWTYLVLLAALGTVFMEWAWVDKFFHVEKFATSTGIFLSMEALFVAGFIWAQRRDETEPLISAATIITGIASLIFAFYLLTLHSLGEKPWLVFGFVVAADVGLLVLPALRARLYPVVLAAGGLAFLLLLAWTSEFLTTSLLNWGLGLYFGFAVLHGIFPVVLQRLNHGKSLPGWWGHAFPLVALGLVMVSIFKLPELSLFVWVCVLLLDAVVFVLALLSASVLAIVGALVITLAATGLWILRVPAIVSGLPEFLVVIGGFAVLFFIGGIFFARRATKGTSDGKFPLPAFKGLPGLELDVRTQIPSMSAVLPFVLLVMVLLRLPITSPSPVFGLALLLVILLLGVARIMAVDALTLVALVCTLALEAVWHQTRFTPGAASALVELTGHQVVLTPESASLTLAWYFGFCAVFFAFPFIFCRNAMGRVTPWAVGALSGPLHFWLIYRLADQAYRTPNMGLWPAGFAVVTLAALVWLARVTQEKAAAERNALLAWWGGAALCFITLIFPIQFERQWITVGWALEGAALFWLYQRVPHRGLTIAGIGLLCAAFARLALNPAVLEYHPRSATAIWNWYLYAYGVTTVCLFVGAKLVADRRAAGLLATLGTVLAFLLLNIEIADYFTVAGARTLTFQFSGNFARDMTYSIAWALFALVLLVAGIRWKVSAARYASVALLGVTLLKLFLHDLAHLNQLYRIGAFVGVAVVLLLASFVYQRFLSAEAQKI